MNGMSFRHAGTLDDSPGIRVENRYWENASVVERWMTSESVTQKLAIIQAPVWGFAICISSTKPTRSGASRRLPLEARQERIPLFRA